MTLEHVYINITGNPDGPAMALFIKRLLNISFLPISTLSVEINGNHLERLSKMLTRFVKNDNQCLTIFTVNLFVVRSSATSFLSFTSVVKSYLCADVIGSRMDAGDNRGALFD